MRKIEQGRFGELIEALLARGPLYAPVRDDRGVNFQLIRKASEPTLDFYNTLQSPKLAWFPQSEDLIRYRLAKGETKGEAISCPVVPTVVLGMRPWDVKSLAIMDLLFLGGGKEDPYWLEKRRLTTVIGYGLASEEEPDGADFFRTLKIGAADSEGSDVFLLKKDGDLLLEGITEKGKGLLGELTFLKEGTEEDERYLVAAKAEGKDRKTRFFDLDANAAADKLKAVFGSSDLWEKEAEGCISCGTCTFVCPTCHCFDIADETLFRDGVRRRFWDACMFTDFTLEASGHNPRPRTFQRLRQKICHKYSFYIEKFGVVSCVGCGRCTRLCPVNIDIFSLVARAVNLQDR